MLLMINPRVQVALASLFAVLGTALIVTGHDVHGASLLSSAMTLAVIGNGPAKPNRKEE